MATTTTTYQYLTSGSAATYTTPANCVAILVQMVGAGGGGGAAATNNGSAGGDTIFNSIHAAGGSGGVQSAGGGAGGSGGTGSANLRISGEAGGVYSNQRSSGAGGSSPFGGAGAMVYNTAGAAGAANSGSGGSGGASATTPAGGGGGAGEYVELYIASPSATYTYTVGAGGNGGAAGTEAGGNGASGFIKVTEYYADAPRQGVITLTGATSVQSVTLPAGGWIQNVFLRETAGHSPTFGELFLVPVPSGAASYVLSDVVAHQACSDDSTSTGNLSATYNNGTGGVGATLTNNGTQAALVLNAPVANGDRVVITSQTTSAQNGVYVVTDKGSASTNWVLTRATDFDQTADITKGALVMDGNGGTYFFQNSTAPVTIGTSAITFVNSLTNGYAAALFVNILANGSSQSDNSQFTIVGVGSSGFYSASSSQLFYLVPWSNSGTPSFNSASVNMTLFYNLVS